MKHDWVFELRFEKSYKQSPCQSYLSNSFRKGNIHLSEFKTFLSTHPQGGPSMDELIPFFVVTDFRQADLKNSSMIGPGEPSKTLLCPRLAVMPNQILSKSGSIIDKNPRFA
jgi:hypothetical protein